MTGARSADVVIAGGAVPVEPRQRTVFVIHCRDAPAGLPLCADPRGVWLQPEDNYHIAGWSPIEATDKAADRDDFESNFGAFEGPIWPALAHCIPAFAATPMLQASEGHFDYNALDKNGIIGRHTEVPNHYVINGVSGHGLQPSLAAVCAIAELAAQGHTQTIVTGWLGFERMSRLARWRQHNVI